MTPDVLALVNAAAARYNVPPALAIAVANQESGGNQYNAEGGVLTSSAGALGVMQLMPTTAAGLGVDPTDTAQNVDGGVRYLSQLLNQFDGNQQLALAAYNWGPGNVQTNGLENWPTETMNYVQSILAAIGAGDSSGDASAGVGDTAILGLVLGGVLIFWLAERIFA